ncbi:protein disulfide oxidoreductase [Aliivibrio finisterrensis]|uniref:Protein disulfide oxidoreductase n=1 Tax=Aliivibrio finisterrensis TaxID=511998 RepID=A0A6N6RUE0_9GAMM|nr:protein disulfide oxidoreductase [Aliivibrio finisterrensis]KAB2825090.1 protein disulfide oxidoreductase [Aliivibrio finisterrensis]
MTTKKIAAGKKQKAIHWFKEIIKFTVFITLFSVAVDYWRSQDMPSETPPKLSINTIDGEWVDITKMSYKEPVLVYFWATWCPVCTMVSPSVSWLANGHQVVSVAITSGDNNRLAQYMNYKDYDFPVINDSTGNIGREWGVTATPSIVIVKNGEISSITTGVTTPIGLWLRLFFA